MIGGQMGYPQVAGSSLFSRVFVRYLTYFSSAFDPIFWLHHCNVDRMLSLWSAVNPGVWVTRGPSDVGSFTIPANTPIDANTRMLNTL